MAQADGTEYAVFRAVDPERPGVVSKRWVHRDCLPRYLAESAES
ncbi:hypothetical protein [Halosimplex amylolyticum]